MKLLFENWRKYLNEEKDNTRSFVFSEPELRTLNQSIARIVAAAKKILGAEGATPMITAKSLEKVVLDKSQKDSAPMQMVAEGDDEDNVYDLRQKYYGPEGELEKHGPRAVKGLEKGLGQMDAEEFEESGYVLKVDEEVLKDFQLMIEETKKTGELFTQARDWYHNIRSLLDKETNNDRDSALLGLLIAVYSPRAKFALNLAEAAFMFKAVQQDAADQPELLKQYLETFPGSERREPGVPRGFTNANKVPNFALNIVSPNLAGARDPETGGMTYNDMYRWNSTIDTWMIDAFYPMLKKASTAKEWETIKGKLMSNVVSYRYMAQLVAREAQKLNLLPHELQAIVWVSMQIRQTGDPGLGVTTEFAVNQIKEAITNIKTINKDLAAIQKEFEEKSWLGMLFDEIDNEGFEEAGRYLLGVKNEKGKVVVPGVRSITASGKKGSSYRYYSPSEGPKRKIKVSKKKAGAKKQPRQKELKPHQDEKFANLKTFYVMNNIIQMPTGKFNNLYDAVVLYMDPNFSTDAAVEYIQSRFDPEAKSTRQYFTENVEIAPGQSHMFSKGDVGTAMPNTMAYTMGKFRDFERDSQDSKQVVKVVIHRNGKILILLAPGGRLDLPGGHIAVNELPLAACRREVYEETGLMFHGNELIDLNMPNKNKRFYSAPLMSDDIFLSNEHEDYKLVDENEIASLNIKPSYKKAIFKALERDR